MKKVNFLRLIRSIILIVLTSTVVSFIATGDVGAISAKVAATLFATGLLIGLMKIKNPMPSGLAFEALVISDTTYAGEAASYMLTKAVTGSDTIQKGVAHIEDGIKKKFTIPRVDVSNFMQKRKATPVSKGSITVDAQVLEPQDCMLYTEFNPRDFEAHWFATQLEPKLIDATLPPTAESFVMLQQMKRLNEWFESLWHQSRIDYDPDGAAVDPATKGAPASGSPLYDTDGNVSQFYIDGFIKKALDNANTIDVPSAVALTSSNIIDKFNAAYALVPKALLFKYGNMGLRFVVSYADQQKYEEALASSTYKNQDTTEKGINKFKGYDVVPCAGLPENTFYVTIARPDIEGNMWIGMNSVDDNALQLQKLQANSELYFIKGLFKIDVNFGFFEHLVLYTPQTA